MKQEVDCNVIRDLLPLYEDSMVSEESAELVREHLKDCPGCREDLRKIRTPISVPPEEDKELWERFEARRARQRRRRRIGIACILSLLAAVVVFCFWYTRPQTWTEITGEEVYVDFAGLAMLNVDWDAEADAKLRYEYWKIWQEDPRLDEAGDAILRILGRYTFRASLASLLPRDGFSLECQDDATVYMVWGEKREFFYFGDNGMVGSIGNWRCDIYRYDPALFDELAQIVRKYGTLDE